MDIAKDIIKVFTKDIIMVVAKDIAKDIARDTVKNTAKDTARYYHKLEAVDFILAHRLDFTKDNFPKDFDYFTL